MYDTVYHAEVRSEEMDTEKSCGLDPFSSCCQLDITEHCFGASILCFSW